MNRIRQIAAALGLALCATAAPAQAQLASTSTAALGMGENFTAAARGYGAIAWNPAGLALSGGPDWSFNIANVRGTAGLDPITLSELADYENRLVPDAVKRAWLDAIEDEGSEAGSGGFDATWLALQVGRFGLQVSTSAHAIVDVTPGIAQLLLFGNADENWNPVTVDLDGSAMDVAAFTTGGISWAHPFPLTGRFSRLSVGATAKYTVGHLLAHSLGSTGTASSDPLEIDARFPVVHTPFGDEEDDQFEANTGSGIGLDIGAGVEMGIWTFSLTLQNVVNTFEWDEDMLRFRAGELHADEDTTETNFDVQPIDAAPASLLDEIEDLTFKRSIAAGAMAQLSDRLKVTADLRMGSSEGIITQPTQHLGAGVEFRPVPFLPLRAGAALVTVGEQDSGLQFGGGIGLDVLGMNFAASGLIRNTGLGQDHVLQFTFLSRGGN